MTPENLLIEPLDPAAAEDEAAMSALCDLVNRVYAMAENGMWVEGTTRTSSAELAGFTRAGEIVVARLSGRIVGVVRLRTLGDALSEFGMLAAAPEHRGVGVGRELVHFAERHSVVEGRPVMQLELLVPRAWSHPPKEFVAGWYDRMGYRLVRVGTVDEAYPHLADLLATPCDFRIYHKRLGDSPANQRSPILS